MVVIPEREVLKRSLTILRKVFQEWVKVERRPVGLYKNRGGHYVTIGKKGEADIGGWVLRGPYQAKPIHIEVKRSDFRPFKLSQVDRERFMNQCQFLHQVNQEGGIGFWLNDPRMLYHVLMPVLMVGARVALDDHYQVVVTRVVFPGMIKSEFSSGKQT